MAVYGPCPRSCTRVRWPCTRSCTRTVYTVRVYGRVPSESTTVYTAVYGPCPRSSTRSCTLAVYTVMYTGRVHGRVYGRIHSSPMGRAHGRVLAVCTARKRAVWLSTGAVYCTTVYTARVHARPVCRPCTRPCTGRVHGRVHGPYTGRVCTGRVHGLSNLSSLSNVHFTGWASYPRWVGVFPHSWGKTPTLSLLKSKRLARKSKVILNSCFVMCEDMVYSHYPHNFLSPCTIIRFENNEDVLRWASHPTLPLLGD